MKRYVCFYCRGTGVTSVFDPPQDLENYSESDLPGYMKDQPCPLCIGAGAPPFVNIQMHGDNQDVDALPRTEIVNEQRRTEDDLRNDGRLDVSGSISGSI